jgi:hypothetical protein
MCAAAAAGRRQHPATGIRGRRARGARRGARGPAARHLLQFTRPDPAVVLLARPLVHDGAGAPGQRLPLVGNPLPDAAGEGVVPVYVSEAMVDLYGARPAAGWTRWPRLSPRCQPATPLLRGRRVARLRAPARQRGDGPRRLPAPLGRPPRQRPGAAPGARAPTKTGARGHPHAGRSAQGAGPDRVRLGRADPRHLAAHLRPQLRRHLLAAGGGDRHRPVRRGGQLQRPGAGAAQASSACWRTWGSRAGRSWVVALEGLAWTALGALAGLALGWR